MSELMKRFIGEVREIVRSKGTEEVMAARVVERMKMILGDSNLLTTDQLLVKCGGVYSKQNSR